MPRNEGEKILRLFVLFIHFFFSALPQCSAASVLSWVWCPIYFCILVPNQFQGSYCPTYTTSRHHRWSFQYTDNIMMINWIVDFENQFLTAFSDCLSAYNVIMKNMFVMIILTLISMFVKIILTNITSRNVIAETETYDFV